MSNFMERPRSRGSGASSGKRLRQEQREHKAEGFNGSAFRKESKDSKDAVAEKREEQARLAEKRQAEAVREAQERAKKAEKEPVPQAKPTKPAKTAKPSIPENQQKAPKAAAPAPEPAKQEIRAAQRQETKPAVKEEKIGEEGLAAKEKEIKRTEPAELSEEFISSLRAEKPAEAKKPAEKETGLPKLSDEFVAAVKMEQPEIAPLTDSYKEEEKSGDTESGGFSDELIDSALNAVRHNTPEPEVMQELSWGREEAKEPEKEPEETAEEDTEAEKGEDIETLPASANPVHLGNTAKISAAKGDREEEEQVLYFGNSGRSLKPAFEAAAAPFVSFEGSNVAEKAEEAEKALPRRTIDNDPYEMGTKAQNSIERAAKSAFANRPSGRRPSGYGNSVPRTKAKASGVKGGGSGGSNNGNKPKKPNIFVRMVRAIFPCKGDGVAESVRKVIFDIAVIAFVITGGSVVLDLLDEAKQINIVDKEIEEIYDNSINGTINLEDTEIQQIQQEKPGISDSFLELYAKNNDVVGWIRIGEAGTDENGNQKAVISYPVVQAEDNKYYLDHNINKEESKRGAIYADYRNIFLPDNLSGNTVLYGHNMSYGDKMFAKLSRYYDGRLDGDTTDRLAFYKKYPTITFNTLYDDSEWKVFACVLFNTQEELGEVYPYHTVHEFANKEAFNSYILDIMDRSVLWTDVDLTYGDSILTLSTCYYPYGKENADTRCAVFARKVREGESAEVDVSKAVINTNPLKFRYQYEREGGSWQGRTWDTSKLLSYES
ncbi:MAG: sortase domain-bontaining protein [Ruminiclostridium sp.]